MDARLLAAGADDELISRGRQGPDQHAGQIGHRDQLGILQAVDHRLGGRGHEQPPAGADATIASYTVLYEAGVPASLVLLCDLVDGRRTLVAVNDAALAAATVQSDPLGRDVRIEGAGRATVI